MVSYQSTVEYILRPILCFTETSLKGNSPVLSIKTTATKKTNPERKTARRIHLSSTSAHFTFSQKETEIHNTPTV